MSTSFGITNKPVSQLRDGEDYGVTKYWVRFEGTEAEIAVLHAQWQQNRAQTLYGSPNSAGFEEYASWTRNASRR